MNSSEMRKSETNEPADALREFCATFRKKAEKIAEAVYKAAEELAETLAPLIESMTKELAELLPLMVEEIRRGCAYKPTKKDAPRKTGRPHAAARPRKILYRARCGI